WRITQVSPKQYKFINVNSGKALDITAGGTSNGTKVIQYTYNGGPNQMWSFTPTGDGFYKFSPGSNPSASLQPASSTEGAAVVQWAGTGAENQQWNILPVYAPTP